MKEIGIVESAAQGVAKVRTTRSEACAHCGAKGMCEALGGSQENLVDVEDPLGVSPGQHVEIVLESKQFVTATFVIYMIPVLALVLGTVLGKEMGPNLGYTSTSGAVVGALVFGSAAFLAALRWGKRLGDKSSYRPRIGRVVHSSENS